MPNQELFDRVLNRIAADPQSFDMRWWYAEEQVTRCGTKACLAGHTLLEEGWTLPLDEDRYARVAHKDGVTRSIGAAARDALDLTNMQAAFMFELTEIGLQGYVEDHAPTNVEELSMRWKAVTSSG